MPSKEKNNNQSKNLTLWHSLKQECYSSVFPFYFSRKSCPFDSVDLTKYGTFRVDPKSSRYSNVWTGCLTLKFLSLNFELVVLVYKFFNSNQGTQFEITVYNVQKLLANDALFSFSFFLRILKVKSIYGCSMIETKYFNILN